jgi:hypothetical protein
MPWPSASTTTSPDPAYAAPAAGRSAACAADKARSRPTVPGDAIVVVGWPTCDTLLTPMEAEAMWGRSAAATAPIQSRWCDGLGLLSRPLRAYGTCADVSGGVG